MLDLAAVDVAVAIVADDELGQVIRQVDDTPAGGEDHGGRLGLRVDVDHVLEAEQPEPLAVLVLHHRVVGIGLVFELLLELIDLVGRPARSGGRRVGALDALGVDDQRAEARREHDEHEHPGDETTGHAVEGATVAAAVVAGAAVDQQSIAGEPADHGPHEEGRDDRDDRDDQREADEAPPVEATHEGVQRHGEGTADASGHCVPPDTLESCISPPCCFETQTY